MHLGVDTAIVGLLVNDETFGAGLDNRHVIFRFHRTHLDGDRRKIRSESAHAFSEIIAAHKFWMLARDEKHLPKSLTREMLCLGDHFIHVEGNAQDGIVARETAILTIVYAFVRQIKRREDPHRASKILQSQRARSLCQRFEFPVGFQGN